MPISMLSAKEVFGLLKQAAPNTQILDVREPAEFQEEHLQHSVNMPLSSLEKTYSKLDNQTHYVLLCQSGKRAQEAAKILESLGFEHLSVAEPGIEMSRTTTKSFLVYPKNRKLWTIDRQFRMALGLLLALGLSGKFLLSDWFLLIPIIISLGLIVTSLLDRCYFRSLIAAMPWNKVVPSH